MMCHELISGCACVLLSICMYLVLQVLQPHGLANVYSAVWTSPCKRGRSGTPDRHPAGLENRQVPTDDWVGANQHLLQALGPACRVVSVCLQWCLCQFVAPWSLSICWGLAFVVSHQCLSDCSHSSKNCCCCCWRWFVLLAAAGRERCHLDQVKRATCVAAVCSVVVFLASIQICSWYFCF